MKKGIYRHYKGNDYEVIDTAVHTETEEELVIYRALYETEINNGGLWARPKAMFEENISVNGNSVPRFNFIRDI